MSTAVALPPSNHNSPLPRDSDRRHSTQHHSTVPAGRSPVERNMSTVSRHGRTPPSHEERREQAPSRPSPPGKQPPPSSSQTKHTSSAANPSSNVPVIKKERPNSPEPPQRATTPTSRHRPQRLDLSTNTGSTHALGGGRPSAPLTSKESAPLSAIQDVGIACLSPGFLTQDPAMQQQLQRSMDVREQQRHIIEARLNKTSKDTDAGSSRDNGLQTSAFPKPLTSKRKRPPPGLSINAPSAQQFANEPRTVQSAPLHHSFTGLKAGPPDVHPLSRRVDEPPPHHHHHHHHMEQSASASNRQQPLASPTQGGTRLPPIADVISSQDHYASSSARPSDTLARNNSGPAYAPIGASGKHSPRSAQENGPLQSPGLPPSQQNSSTNLHVQTSASRTRGDREYRSAEEAVQSMTGGREDLLPKIVHYGGHQPPTPPSPLPPAGTQFPSMQSQHGNYGNHHHHHHPSPHQPPASATGPSFPGYNAVSGRRRTREEYEREQEGSGEDEHHRGAQQEKRRHSGQTGQQGPFGAGRDSPDTQRKKKEEFIALCERAWDLFHS